MEDFDDLPASDLADFEEQELYILGFSAENGIARVYRKNGAVRVIKFALGGETGRIDVVYIFSLKDESHYLVKHTSHRFTLPIILDGSKTSFELVARFAVCGDESGGMNPPKAYIADTYNNVIRYLAGIRKRMEKEDSE